MMNELTLLTQLSTLAGILPGYVDKQHMTSPATQRALLTTMGIDVFTLEKITLAIAKHELHPWQHMLEPVTVLRTGTAQIRPVMPDTYADKELTWNLALEDGGNHGGRFRPAQLPQLETRKIDGVAHTAWQFEIPVSPAPGYHRLELSHAKEILAAQAFIVAPTTYYQSAAITGTNRVWGPAVQLYAVRSEPQWGMGDCTDLRLLLEQWAVQGADIIDINGYLQKWSICSHSSNHTHTTRTTTEIVNATWENNTTTLAVAELLTAFPVAVLQF